ncbi:AAA family ATPase [Lacinutrix salivirga]
MNTKKIVITGGPGTGKSSIIEELTKRGYTCFEEVSRQITLEARQEGIEQLFLENPMAFSDKLLEARINQFKTAEASNNEFVFLDRGIPDITAYMDYIGDSYPTRFIEACENNLYDAVFILGPWQDIYKTDNERYESFEQAKQIHQHLLDTYKKYDYGLRDVPFGSIGARADHIINVVKAL